MHNDFASDEQDSFRVCSEAEISRLLEQLRDSPVMLNLDAPNGSMMGVPLWTIDAANDTLSLKVDPRHPSLQAVIESNEATAVAYLDHVKLQFDLQDLVLIHGDEGSTLHCAFPRELFRFQRRNSLRVQPLHRTSLPQAFLRHPMIAEMQLELRIVDISMTGCALLLPANVPPLDLGIRINDARFILDHNTSFTGALHLHHVTGFNATPNGVHLGCEFLALGIEPQRVLQRYIEQNQKQRQLLKIGQTTTRNF